MLSQEKQKAVYDLWLAGTPARSASRSLLIPRSTIRGYYTKFGAYPNWLEEADSKSVGACHPCGFESHRADFTPAQWASYTYLLGLYLGDGCLSRSKKTWVLRIFQTSCYTGLVQLCLEAMKRCWPRATIWAGASHKNQNCTVVVLRHVTLPDAFPQHGIGRKHTRKIQLTSWQEAIVRDHAIEFLRGLIHSDGCRSTNTTTNKRTGKAYRYTIYTFSNMSEDIRNLCVWASNLLGLSPTLPTKKEVAFRRRKDVLFMEAHIGPKH